MRINYNVSAMLTNNALANNDNFLSQSLQRLSSGLKINNAKDNPAGLAISKRMNAQLEGLSVANQNAGDGVSIIETADGALTEVAEMLQRMNELCVQAANGTLSDDDRQVIQDEIAQLKDEIERVADATEFNGQPLLNGEFDVKGYTSEENIKVTTFSDTTPAQTYVIDSLTIAEEEDEFGNTVKTVTGIAYGENFPEGLEAVEVDDSFVTIKGKQGFEIKLDIKEAEAGTYTGVEVEVADVGPMRLQIGANEGQTIDLRIPELSLLNAGINKTDVSTMDGANKAIVEIKNAISYVSQMRSRMGAYQNRLEHTETSIATSEENITSAYSRIMDTDMAEEMTEYTSMQVVTQAATSMLTQANERPSQMLQLLQ